MGQYLHAVHILNLTDMVGLVKKCILRRHLPSGVEGQKDIHRKLDTYIGEVGD